MNVSRNLGKPRVIRKVTKVDAKGRPKVARDRRTKNQIERIKAKVSRQCGYYDCPHGRRIEVGTEFAALTNPSFYQRIGHRSVPVSRPYHFECVPPDCRPLVRFFR